MSQVVPPSLEQARARRSRFEVLEAALHSFRDLGYEATTYKEIAKRAGVSTALVGRYFPAKEQLAVAAYHKLADELAARVVELQAGSLAERFQSAMLLKLDLLEQDRDAYLALASRAFDPRSKEGVLSTTTVSVRARVLSIFRVVVDGALDAPRETDARARLTRTLYGAHLLAILIWTQTSTLRARQVVVLVSPLLQWASPVMLTGLLNEGAANQLDQLSLDLLGVPALERETDRARAIVARLFRTRRLLAPSSAAASEEAFTLQLPLVLARIAEGRPLELALPAFPAKSPSKTKVLGKLPDAAEAIALQMLAELVFDLEALHPPGVSLVICSDGHVFADIVGVGDADATSYRREFEILARSVLGDRVRIFGLVDVAPKGTFADRRAWLMRGYADSLERVHERASTVPHLRAQVDGIHRFLSDDAMGADVSLTRTQAQKRTRPVAYEVVRRSEAWGRVVSAVFPGAVRLSIHPQPEVSEKIGVALSPMSETDDPWLTPWHSVALYRADRVQLVHRAAAEAEGAELVLEQGRPWAMRLP
jgi:pyoverdine/dityrosine biosynthesis protein Dit1